MGSGLSLLSDIKRFPNDIFYTAAYNNNNRAVELHTESKKNLQKRKRPFTTTAEHASYVYRWYRNVKQKIPVNQVCPITHNDVNKIQVPFDLISHNSIRKRYDAFTLAKHFSMELAASRLPQHPEDRCIIDSITLKRLQHLTNNTDVYDKAVELILQKLLFYIDLRLTFYTYIIRRGLELCASYENNIMKLMRDPLGKKPIMQLIRLSFIAQHIQSSTLNRIHDILLRIVFKCQKRLEASVTATTSSYPSLQENNMEVEMLISAIKNMVRFKKYRLSVHYFQNQDSKDDSSSHSSSQSSSSSSPPSAIVCRVSVDPVKNISVYNNSSYYKKNNNSINIIASYLSDIYTPMIMQCLPFTWDFYI